MLRTFCLLALSCIVGAQVTANKGKCVQTSPSDITEGICAGTSMGGKKVCIPADFLDDHGQDMLKVWTSLVSEKGRADCVDWLKPYCGGTSSLLVDQCDDPRTKYCTFQESLFYQTDRNPCETDSDCNEIGKAIAAKRPCCSDFKQAMRNMCDTSDDRIDTWVTELTKPDGHCTDDSTCINIPVPVASPSSAASLSATLLPAAAAAVALIAAAWN
eukprot:CAMPEP_0173448000 /NCGR_PEP_ID=MMETSP1357-20121228/39869_1 /TAXON_ID=77926 /ORGANISM="Hemiselmis rufescens, Strain PCC563" /LENGTH=214 /DNA_ID=CAMNT_0014414447 /DNA_START=41 /DNA_END=685 /DNA_ORIENTATION=+